MAFWLGNVPDIMRSKGWTTGAACMEHWFRAPVYEMTLAEKSGRVDYRTVTASHIESRIVTMAGQCDSSACAQWSNNCAPPG